MGEKLPRMNACIRSSTTHYVDIGFENCGQGLIQRFLNGWFLGLYLPPKISATVVGQSDEISERGSHNNKNKQCFQTRSSITVWIDTKNLGILKAEEKISNQTGGNKKDNSIPG
jgi:hypothetical protein